MNTNPKAKRILCFGDSNTQGTVLDPVTMGWTRLSPKERWTGILQTRLGEKYEVIEEGLAGRTTNLDDPGRPGLNGKTYLIPCLLTHNPVELVILMLGTNDLKEWFQRTPEEVAESMSPLIKLVKEYGHRAAEKESELIIVAPPLVNEAVAGVKDEYLGAEDKSKQLGRLYQNLARRERCPFIDAALITTPSPHDGLHLEPADQQKLAEALYQKVLSLKI